MGTHARKTKSRRKPIIDGRGRSSTIEQLPKHLRADFVMMVREGILTIADIDRRLGLTSSGYPRSTVYGWVEQIRAEHGIEFSQGAKPERTVHLIASSIIGILRPICSPTMIDAVLLRCIELRSGPIPVPDGSASTLTRTQMRQLISEIMKGTHE